MEANHYGSKADVRALYEPRRRHSFVETIAVCILPLVTSSCLSPPEGIVHGSSLLEESVFYEAERFGPVIEIAPVRINGADRLGLFTHGGAHYLDPTTRKATAKIRYEHDEYLATLHVIDVDQDGTDEIAAFGGGPFPDTVFLLDAAGKIIWKKRKLDFGWRGFTVGDLDRDGKPEIYFSEWYTVERLALDGQTLWRKRRSDTSYSKIFVYDPPDAPEPFLLALSRGGEAEFYDHNGDVLRSASRLRANRASCLIRWPVGDRGPRLVSWRNRVLQVMDTDGRKEFSHRFPLSYPGVKAMKAVIVLFEETEEPLLAVRVRFGNYTGRGMLCLFSLSGELKFGVGMGKGYGLAAMRLPGTPGQVLLVADKKKGEHSKILMYRLADKLRSTSGQAERSEIHDD